MSTPPVRWSLQLRLTLLYCGLFLAAGAMLLVITYVLVAGSHFVDTPSQPTVPQPAGLGGTIQVPGPSVDNGLADEVAAQRQRDLRGLLEAEGVALGFMTVVSAGLGWLVARRALRPLRSMAGTARQISEQNLHERLAINGPHDEVRELADTIDGLLGRLEGSFEAQRRFVANASHELRTPLTVERSLLEVALADRDATAGQLRHTCERVLANNQHQERLIEALLTLARSQRGLDRAIPLELAQLAGAVLTGRDPAATEQRLETDLGQAHTEGDRPLVERLATNLIDNAFRHNVPGGWVRVWTGTHDGRPALRVSNSCPEIQPEEIVRLFQPFQRLPPDRTAATASDGLGIGLSIVDAIATAHGATIDAHPIPGGGLDMLVQFRSVRAAGERHQPLELRAGVAPLRSSRDRPSGRPPGSRPTPVNHRETGRSQQ